MQVTVAAAAQAPAVASISAGACRVAASGMVPADSTRQGLVLSSKQSRDDGRHCLYTRLLRSKCVLLSSRLSESILQMRQASALRSIWPTRQLWSTEHLTRRAPWHTLRQCMSQYATPCSAEASVSGQRSALQRASCLMGMRLQRCRARARWK
jgi:hypothetical protein